MYHYVIRSVRTHKRYDNSSLLLGSCTVVVQLNVNDEVSVIFIEGGGGTHTDGGRIFPSGFNGFVGKLYMKL